LDSDILLWAQRADRIVITEDAATFPTALAGHLGLGRASPGVFVIRQRATMPATLAWLELVVADDHPDQWRDQAIYIP